MSAFKSNIQAWGDTIGVNVTLSTIRGGVKIEVLADTDEAKRRIFRSTGTAITKLIIEIRRVGEFETVTYSTDWSGPMKQLAELLGPVTPGPELDAAQKHAEHLLGVPAGSCRVI